MNFPCRVSAEERIQSGKEYRAEQDAYAASQEQIDLAMETIRDGVKLEAILDNESFAHPVAKLCACSEAVALEWARLQREFRLNPKDFPAMADLLNAASQIERAAFNLAMGE